MHPYDELSTEEVLCKTVPTKKRGRPRKHVYVEELSEKEEEGEKQVPLSSLKRRMIATEGLGSQSSKRLCKNGSGTSPPSRRSPLFVCNVEGCKRKFKEEPALYAHARVHGDRAYACHYEGCNKSFSERSKLKRHFLIHTGEKPFLCLFEGCGKAFSLDFNLRSHTKTHTGDYNECPYANCDKHYCQEYKLRAHIAKVHSKSPRGTRKMATLENIQHRSHTQHVKAKAKRTNLLAEITVQSVKLKEAKEGRVHRIAELERQRRREAAELARIEQDLGKLERKQRQLKEGQKDCAIVTSLSLSGGEDEEDKGEEIAPSFSTATHTSSSGEEQSRLSNLPGTEYMAMGEGKEILMVPHKLPKTDQGASLVMASSETQLLNSQQPETIVSLTPLLWLQGTPPNQGHLAGQPGSQAYLRTQRPMSMSELRAIQNSAKPIGSSHATSGAANPGGFRMIENSSDQHKHTTGDVLRQGESSHAGIQHLNATKVRKLEAHRKVSHEATKLKVQTDRELVRCDKGAVQSSASSSKSDKNVQIAVIGKGSIKKLEGEDTRIQKQKRTRDCHLSTADQAFVSLTPLLLSTDNRFSPTDARFLAASETLPSAMQRTIWGSQQNKQEEAVKVSYSGRNSVANEVSCSINVVSTYCTQNGGFSAEQSFEPSAAQLFTYQEQPRLVD
ncbi:hypothetical protein CY35_02G196400 [Sphagnum magellanicum]|nr:hypothetical protein CY35_02G196400 [Sphagnum magellanicum]